jgi:hypothetical protein
VDALGLVGTCAPRSCILQYLREHDRGEEYTMSRGHVGTNEPSGDGAQVGRRRCKDPSGVGVAQCEAGGWSGARRWCMGEWGVRRKRVEMPRASAGAAQAGSRADCTTECGRTEGVPVVGCVGAQWGMTQRQAGWSAGASGANVPCPSATPVRVRQWRRALRSAAMASRSRDEIRERRESACAWVKKRWRCRAGEGCTTAQRPSSCAGSSSPSPP